MTKELDWLEQQPRRTCRGPQNQDLDAVKARLEREAANAEARAEKTEDDARAKQLTAIAAKHRRCLEAIPEDAERTGAAVRALNATDRDLAAHLDKMAHDRKCGADLNPTIFAEVPETGVSTAFQCPSCGHAHHATRVPATVEA